MHRTLTRRFALLCAMLSIGLAAVAETHYKPHISIGGRAGVSLSKMSFSPGVKQGWLTGTAGAVTFRYSEEKIFGLIAEFGWEQRGWKENFEEANSFLSYSRSLTYLRLPVMTHIYFGGRRFKGFINLGPEVSYMIGDKISSNFNYEYPGDVEGFPDNRMLPASAANFMCSRATASPSRHASTTAWVTSSLPRKPTCSAPPAP